MQPPSTSTSEPGLAKRQLGHRARLALSREQEALVDAQAHGARALWNLLHNWWLMTPRCKRSLAAADAAIRQARKDLDWLAVLPAQAAQAVLKTYFQAWKNCWEGRAVRPEFKARYRTQMAVDIPQGRDLQIKRVHRRWGMATIPKVGRVKFRWTKDLPVGKRADKDNRITGARLVKDALGWHIAFRGQTMLAYKLARRGGTLAKVPPAGTSQRCHACGHTTSGSRERQAMFACKNPGCGWTGNADLNAARNILHHYLITLAHRAARGGGKGGPAAGRAVVRRATRGVEPAAAR